jgi:hypothetical protein
MVKQWAEANAQWVVGTEFVPEVDLLPVGAGMPEGWWGEGLPEGLNVAPDMAALLGAIRLGGYLAYDETALAALGSDVGPARTLVLVDAAVLDARGPGLVSKFVEEGGRLLAFGHASLLDETGAAKAEYPLAEVFGASHGGLVQFDTEASRVALTADTTYAPQFSPPNVIDGRAETFWASIEAGPMPHWVQLDFATPRRAASAQVSCRPAFLLKDFEVQAKVGEGWKTLASVKDNKEWVIDCPFAEPVEAQSFRLFLTREELNGENRVIADVGEFTLLDEKGARLIAPPYLIEGRILDKPWAQANRSERLVLRSPAVRLKPTKAQVIATFPDPLTGEPLPLCTVNKVGKGRVYQFAVPEAALGYAPETWEALLRTFVGMPMIRHSGDENVVAFLRRGRGKAILHVIDTAPVESEERAKDVIVRADTKALGKVKAVKALPEGTALITTVREGWVQFTMPIAPMGTVLMELGR